MYKGVNGQIVYAEDIECVVDPVQGKGGIFIGNLEASQNLQTLKKNRIAGVLTSAKGVFLNHSKEDVPHHLYIPGEDHERFDISQYFDQASEWIRDKLQQTNVLVHCLAGVSRSVSLVIAYLIKYKGMSFDDAFYALKSRRKIIHPNEGFKKQLREYEQKVKFNKPRSPERFNRNQISPERSRYLRQSMTKRYDQSTSYARQAFSPTKKYHYYQKPYGRQSEVGGSLAKRSLASSSNIYNIEQIDRKIDQRRQSVHLAERNRTLRDYQNYGDYQSSMMTSAHPKVSQSFETMNEDLDKKISQIRKKYQDYAENNFVSSGRVSGASNTKSISNMPFERFRNLGLREKAYSGIELENNFRKNENPEFGLGNLRMRKITSDYDRPTGSTSNFTGIRNYQYQAHDICAQKSRPYTGSQMRRILSYQQR